MGYALKNKEKLSQGMRRIETRQVGCIMEQLKEWRPERNGSNVHQARKDLKKARAALRLIREKLDAADYRKANRNFREVGLALSPWRDTEVLLKTVVKMRKNCPDRRANEVLATLHEILQKQHEEIFRHPPQVGQIQAELRAARRYIKGWRLSGLKWSDLSCGSQRIYKQGRKAFYEAERTRTPENLHTWRKRVKDLWYQMCILQPSRPAAMARRARKLKKLSAYLGDDHDLVMLKQAAGTAKLEKGQIELLDELVDSRRGKLEQAAFELGQRLYSRKPASFARRVKRYGKKWCAR